MIMSMPSLSRCPTSPHSESVLCFLFVSFVFLPFLEPLPRYMEVPRLGGLIGAVATSLHQSHSNMESELRLRPTPQLMATPDP